MKYIKKFETHTEYEVYKNSQEYLTPNVSYCVDLNEVHFEKYVRDYSKEYLTFKAVEDTTFKFTKSGLSYSLDNGDTWTSLAANTATPTVNAGNEILFKGTMRPSSSYQYGIGTFSSTGKFNASGNIMSLLFGNNFFGQTDLTGKNWTFYQLFYNNTRLVDASNLMLPATTLAGDCYRYMFQNCASLTAAPELPATTLAGNCYMSMFMECTSLTTAPELPATTLASYCYYGMFRTCTSLTTAPELPATILADSCYSNMFTGCTSLTTAPELPATTLDNSCYTYMFNDCSNLNYIKAMFTITPSTTYTSNWVKGVSSSGTFVKNSAATWNVTGDNGIPSGWTIETATPVAEGNGDSHSGGGE